MSRQFQALILSTSKALITSLVANKLQTYLTLP